MSDIHMHSPSFNMTESRPNWESLIFVRMRKLGLFLLLTLLIASCRDSVRDEDLDTTTARDHMLAQTVFLDVMRQVHRIAIEDSLFIEASFQSDLQDDCMDSIFFTTSPTARYKVLWLDYGQVGTDVGCEDLKNRGGKINITIDGFYPDDFTVLEIALFSYQVDSMEIEGNFTYTLVGQNGNGEKEYNLVVEDGFISSSKYKISWDADYFIVQTEGNNLPKPFDDVFRFEGRSTGRGTIGSAFEVETKGNWFYDMDCLYPYGVNGVQEMDIPDLTTRFITFSDECVSTAKMSNINIASADLEIDY
jgi:hypothetical protein